MYNPTLRLLTVLEMLQSRNEVSGAEFAQALEVDLRSVRRYITMLRDMGIPIEGERGRHGGYSLRPGFKLPPLMFNADEITAVKMSLMLMREIGATSIQAVESASAKVERVLTEELRAITNALQYAVKLEDILPGTRAVPNALTVILSRAVYEHSSVEIAYASGEGETSIRTIDPYGLVLHAHAWYVPAYCHLRRDLRIFRVDRIRVATPTGHTFTVPEGFDARTAVLYSLARVFGSVPFEVLLHVPYEIAREYISPGLAILKPAGDDTLMQAYAEDPSWFARRLATIEIPFTVISNDALRDAVKSLANELLASVKTPVPRS